MKKKLSLILLVAILLLAAYLRLYRISDYMTFLGDEGRDVMVAKGILEGHLTLLGPRSSAGDFFMGPAYYYMITPFLFLFNYDPVGPAVMVGLLSVVTTWLISFVGKKWFSEKAGLVAAALYAVSPVVTTYSHSSWNPDVLPFFALLLIYMLYKAIDAKKPWKYFLLVGFLLGIALQLHYLAILLGVVTAVYIPWALWYKTKKKQIKQTIVDYSQVLIGFIIGFSPFIAFEVRHGFANTKAIFSFIFSDTLHKTYAANMSYFSIISDVFFRIFARLVFYFPSPDKYNTFSQLNLELLGIFAMLISIFSIIVLFFTKNKSVVMLCSVWLFLSIALLGLYKKSIYDYLFTFIFPLPFLIVGNGFVRLAEFGKQKTQKMLFASLSIVLFMGTIAFNLTGMPFRYLANHQKNQAKIIAEAVIARAANKPYNFALISKGNSDYEYRYYLDILGHPPVVLENTINDPKRTTVTGQLLVVCEDIMCEPLGNPLFDVAGFGRAEVAGEWDVSVVKLYKLVPYVQSTKQK